MRPSRAKGIVKATSKPTTRCAIYTRKDLDAEVASLSTLVDQIGEYLRRRSLSQAPFATWVSIANEPVYPVTKMDSSASAGRRGSRNEKKAHRRKRWALNST